MHTPAVTAEQLYQRLFSSLETVEQLRQRLFIVFRAVAMGLQRWLDAAVVVVPCWVCASAHMYNASSGGLCGS